MLVEAGELRANLTGQIIKCRVQSVECKMAGELRFELRFGPFCSGDLNRSF